MKKKNTYWSVMSFTIITFLLAWTLSLSVSFNVQALSSRVSIQIQQHPPFFSPPSVSAEAGSVIQWENRGREPHSILSDDCLRRSKCAFESRMLEPGEQFVLSELPAGDYAYHCGIHPFMRGFIRVKGQSWNAPSRSI
ncbi:cupredoxin domain-containing protein [Nitrospira sp. M1]